MTKTIILSSKVLAPFDCLAFKDLGLDRTKAFVLVSSLYICYSLFLFLVSCARLSWPHSAFESTLNSTIVSYEEVVQCIEAVFTRMTHIVTDRYNAWCSLHVDDDVVFVVDRCNYVRFNRSTRVRRQTTRRLTPTRRPPARYTAAFA